MRPNRFRYAQTRTIAISRKGWMAKATLLLLAMVAAMMLIVSRSQPDRFQRLRGALTDGFSPVVGAMSRPAQFIQHADRWFTEVTHLYAENNRLREENARLLQWQNAAGRLKSENESLRQLLKLDVPPSLSFVTARVVGGQGALYSHTFMLGSGEEAGIAQHQAVVTDEGLAGRIQHLGNHSATVLAITDINSRIPVMGELSRQKALLAGDNSDLPVLTYLGDDAEPFSKGERIVTTDDGNVFPAGLVVGEIHSAKDGLVRVAPYADTSRLEYVRVISQSVQ